MTIEVERFPHRTADNAFIVVLDLLDGRKLRSDGMGEHAANGLQDELKRRIFECQDGARKGPRDRE